MRICLCLDGDGRKGLLMAVEELLYDDYEFRPSMFFSFGSLCRSKGLLLPDVFMLKLFDLVIGGAIRVNYQSAELATLTLESEDGRNVLSVNGSISGWKFVQEGSSAYRTSV